MPDVACALGFETATCPDYASSAPVHEAAETVESVDGLPWNGLGLGSDDVAAVAAVGRPIVIALAGAASAGKTTALATTFLELRRGRRLAGRAFAGSFTILGWQILSSHMLWKPYGDGGFPPHTAATDMRSPCLLHLRLRENGGGAAIEVLLSDMPGEWFSAWAIDEADSPGANWLAGCADIFLLFADSEALGSKERRGLARNAYESLARRVHAAAAGRPVLPVLSKADLKVPAPVFAHVTRLNQVLFSAEALRMSAQPDTKAPAHAVIDHAVRLAIQGQAHPSAPIPGPKSAPPADPFLAYRSSAFSARLGGADG